jgi:peptide chain release factor 2
VRACSSSGGIFDVEGQRIKLGELDVKSSRPDFWNDPDRAQEVMQERTRYEKIVRGYDRHLGALDDAEVALELASDGEDPALLEEAAASLAGVEQAVADMQLQRMLGGPHDDKAAIVSINAGAGGTDSQDWAEMLLRMYLRYCEKKGWKTEITDLQPAEEAGIKSATFTVDGPYAFGFLKAEVGIHRLVRMSPFNAAGKRQTSFSSVFVMPDIDDSIHVEIDEKDLRVDTYRSSGAGGQHVNKTDSAVRLTHLPTGIVVACQAERSQHKNRAGAMKILRARLYQEELNKREQEAADLHASKTDIGWGHQIRSYVLQPYRLVKDLRSGKEIGNVDAVLDGELDALIEAYLLMAGSGQAGQAAPD